MACGIHDVLWKNKKAMLVENFPGFVRNEILPRMKEAY